MPGKARHSQSRGLFFAPAPRVKHLSFTARPFKASARSVGVRRPLLIATARLKTGLAVREPGEQDCEAGAGRTAEPPDRFSDPTPSLHPVVQANRLNRRNTFANPICRIVGKKTRKAAFASEPAERGSKQPGQEVGDFIH